MIYSREERARLVFRAEARPEAGLDLLPGQPVSLTRPQ
jgi:HlyD family secretion protein